MPARVVSWARLPQAPNPPGLDPARPLAVQLSSTRDIFPRTSHGTCTCSRKWHARGDLARLDSAHWKKRVRRQTHMAFLNKNIALAIAALVACGSAAATEDYDLRYAPGYGAADMSAPFEGGWVFQAHAYVYSGNVRGTQTVSTDLTGALSQALHTA